MDGLSWLTLVLATAGIWSVFCRLTVMVAGRTRLLVFAQHAVLAVGLFMAAAWTVDWALLRELGAHGWVIDLLATRTVGHLALVASVVIYLLLSAHRWHIEAPEGTNRKE